MRDRSGFGRTEGGQQPDTAMGPGRPPQGARRSHRCAHQFQGRIPESTNDILNRRARPAVGWFRRARPSRSEHIGASACRTSLSDSSFAEPPGDTLGHRTGTVGRSDQVGGVTRRRYPPVPIVASTWPTLISQRSRPTRRGDFGPPTSPGGDSVPTGLWDGSSSPSPTPPAPGEDLGFATKPPARSSPLRPAQTCPMGKPGQAAGVYGQVVHPVNAFRHFAEKF